MRLPGALHAVRYERLDRGGLTCCSRRRKDIPRFSSAVRSVSLVATCTGFPDSRSNQAFSWSGVVVMYLP